MASTVIALLGEGCEKSYVLLLLNVCISYDILYIRQLYGGVMKTTLNLPDDLIKKTMKISGSRTKTAAIVTAMEEYIRRKKLEEIIRMEGKLDFTDDWEKARHER